MPRQARHAPGGIVYHVINRANGRARLFARESDYLAFEKIMEQALQRVPTRVLAYCVMPNHWHQVLWPREDGEMSEYLRWLSVTHAQRWHAAHGTSGQGHVYQGRFKSFPAQSDEHLLVLGRYVERNALRAGLVRRAEDWRWGSLWRRVHGDEKARSLLSEWPIALPRNWVALVNRVQSEAEEGAVLQSIRRSRPLGSPRWTTQLAAKLGLAYTLRPRGRPRKEK